MIRLSYGGIDVEVFADEFGAEITIDALGVVLNIAGADADRAVAAAKALIDALEVREIRAA